MPLKVQILPSSSPKEQVKLDCCIMIAGDFSNKEVGSQGALKDCKLYEIKSRHDFKTTLENINPKLKLFVRNRLVEDPEAQLEVNLDIKNMRDFHPDEIVKKVGRV